MTIKKIDVFPLEYQESNDNFSTRHVVLVRIETHDGVVGWGECISLFRPNTAAITGMLRHGLVDSLIGKDPLDIETHWREMRQGVWWYGNVGGVAAFAISAVDMALWDLKGKILNQPLYKLFGGKKSERLPVCASSHPKASEIDAMAEELAGHIQAGYQLVKVGFGKKGHSNLGVDAERDMTFARAVRDAIGAKAGFIIDVGANAQWDVPRAIRMARAFADLNVTWIEDPFHPDNLTAYQHLRAAVPEMAIGFGERLFTLDAYHQILDADVCDTILVDPGRAEGITGMLKIVELAAQYNVSIDPHTWSTAINTAASLHIALWAERPTIFELKPTPSAMHHELVRNPIEHQDGWVYASDEPGLGVDVVEETVRKYTMDI
jgi:L-alanine-DL-glutamate epimerase-like enolase superfamily enzyme